MPLEDVQAIQRARLLNAVGDVSAEEGFHGTTIRKLLGRSGISRRTFYELFEDKEECYLCAYDETVEHVAALLATAYTAAADAGPDQQLRSALRAFLEFCAANPTLARAFVIEITASGPNGLARRSTVIDRLTDALAATDLALGTEPQERWLKGRLFIGGVHELIYTTIDAGKVADLPALTDQIVEVQLPTLAAR